MKLAVFWGATVVFVVTAILDFLANLFAGSHPTVDSHGWDVSASVVFVIWVIVAYRTFRTRR